MAAQYFSSLSCDQIVLGMTAASNSKVFKSFRPHYKILVATPGISCLVRTFTLPTRENTDQHLYQVTGLKASLS